MYDLIWLLSTYSVLPGHFTRISLASLLVQGLFPQGLAQYLAYGVFVYHVEEKLSFRNWETLMNNPGVS